MGREDITVFARERSDQSNLSSEITSTMLRTMSRNDNGVFMQCPVCKNAMIVLELDQVEIDHCVTCKGTWFDQGELDLLTSHEEDSLFKKLKTCQNIQERSHKCPICLKTMLKCEYEEGSYRIYLDRCDRNHGIWFDKGELEHILQVVNLNSQNKALRQVREVFSKVE